MTDQQRAANPMSSGGREGDLLRSLPEGHVIHTLGSEHVQILGFLRELDTLRNKLLQMATLEESRAILDDIHHYADRCLTRRVTTSGKNRLFAWSWKNGVFPVHRKSCGKSTTCCGR